MSDYIIAYNKPILFCNIFIYVIILPWIIIPSKNLSREETLSMISHELRTSLTASKWMIEMFQDGDMGELTNTQKEMIKQTSKYQNARMMDGWNLITLSKNIKP